MSPCLMEDPAPAFPLDGGLSLLALSYPALGTSYTKDSVSWLPRTPNTDSHIPRLALGTLGYLVQPNMPS